MARRQAADRTERRTAGLTVQFTPTERRELSADAALSGASVAELIRERSLRRFGTAPVVAGVRRDPEAKKLADEINALGINLNQIAHRANVSGAIVLEQRALDVMDLVADALTRVISADPR
jgi:Bacterial mobilisation protein (MobC)